jgi:hypothetical protein
VRLLAEFLLTPATMSGAMLGVSGAEKPVVYKRRQPEDGILHRVVRRELASFYARCDESGRDLPKFVRREFDTFLGCGILQNGFLRVRCQDCGDDRLVAFSCKGRGFCPSCTGRRMSDTAAHLVDRVLPHVPVRQWVLSLPIQIRPMLAYDAALSRATLNTFLRVVFAWYRQRAKRLGIHGAECGAVTSIQRFGSALNLNLHFHVLVVDGVFHRTAGDEPVFRAIKAPSTKDISELTRKIQTRLVRLLERRGVFGDDRQISSDEQALVDSYSASSRGRIGFGENAGKLHQKLLADAPAQTTKDKRSANISGFDLHANVRVKATDRQKLERLCRYVLRPPIAQGRLSETSDGKILFEMKRRFSDGTTHIVFQPLEFLEKLVALIPKPRAHQVLYHGVLAPHAKLRSQVILKPADDDDEAANKTEKPQPPAKPRPALRNRRLSWAELMRRVFAVDVLKCDGCGGNRTIISAITAPNVIRAILDCLGLPTAHPRQHPARAPPEQTELCFP